eukprot:scaffold347_cov380-Prasinococcus_capsulatus_cf.AAC.26
MLPPQALQLQDVLRDICASAAGKATTTENSSARSPRLSWSQDLADIHMHAGGAIGSIEHMREEIGNLAKENAAYVRVNLCFASSASTLDHDVLDDRRKI